MGVGAVGVGAAVLLVPGGHMPGGFVFALLFVFVFVPIGLVFGVVLAAPAVFGGAVGATAALEALGAVSGFSPPAVASTDGACEGAPVGVASGVGCVVGVSGVVVAALPCGSPRPKSMYAPNAPPPIEIAPRIAAATANPRFFGGAAETGTSPGCGVVIGAPAGIAPGWGVFIGVGIGAPAYPPAC